MPAGRVAKGHQAVLQPGCHVRQPGAGAQPLLSIRQLQEAGAEEEGTSVSVDGMADDMITATVRSAPPPGWIMRITPERWHGYGPWTEPDEAELERRRAARG